MRRSEGAALLEILAQHMEAAALSLGVERQKLGVDPEDVLDQLGMQFGFRADAPTGQSGPKARATDPGTSHEAAAGNAKLRKGQQTKLLLAVALAGPRGVTAEELAAETNFPPNSVSTRMSELVRGGFVTESQGGTRRTSTGAKATVYIASDKGRSAATT